MRTRFLLLCVAVATAIAVLAPIAVPGRLTVVITAVLYFPAVLGISALAGYANQVSGGHAAFFGTGAYVTGVVSASGVSPWASMGLGVAASVLIAVVIAIPVLRLRGHFLVLATISVNIVFVVVVRQWGSVTGGSSGLLGIRPLEILGRPVVDHQALLVIALVWAVLATVGTYNLVHSVPGRALKALGASEPAATSMGVSQSNYAVFLFTWSALLAGGSGALFAAWMRFLSPTMFDIHLSITLLLIAVIGGVGSIGGAAVAVVGYFATQEVIASVFGPALGADSPIIEGLMFGVLLLVLVILRPAGLASFVGRRRRDVLGGSLSDTPTISVDERSTRYRQIAEAGLSVRDITQHFGGVRVLEGVGFEASRGEVVALVGPNGAGKSTLLNIISGLLRPGGGAVLFGGASLIGREPHRIARHGVSRSFQTPQLVPSLPVLDNVAVGLHVHFAGPRRTVLSVLGLNHRDEKQIARRALARLSATVPAESELASSVDSLPFGDRRWVEMARATAAEPELILLDEPASGLTDAEREHLMELITRYALSGATVILVEHDMGLVRRVADRVVVLHQGEVLADGPTERVLADARVQEAYLGTQLEPPARAGSSHDGEVVLGVDGLETGYGDLCVVRDVGFEVRSGQIAALLGSNGAGKTTLMRGLTGQLASRGRVRLLGDDVTAHSVDELARRGLVLVPEGRELIPGLNVDEHLRLSVGNRAGRSTEGVMFDAAAIYALFPVLRERGGQLATSLSGGQQQMLAIARALLMQPRVLLIDEPLLGLAPMAAQEVLATIRGLADRGLAVVLAEQQARTVRPYVDVVLRMEHGVLAAEV